jgi:hypothetical protein
MFSVSSARPLRILNLRREKRRSRVGRLRCHRSTKEYDKKKQTARPIYHLTRPAAGLSVSMDDTTALQECGDLSLEIDELSPATQMFLSSSPSLRSHDWDNVTPTLVSSIASEQPPPQPLPPATRRSRNEQTTRVPPSGGALPIKTAERGHSATRPALERGKSASKSKSPSGAPKIKSLALAVAAGTHRDSAEFFERPNGGLLSPPPTFASDFLLFSADHLVQSVPSVAKSTPVCTPNKIDAKSTGRNSKLLRPSPNVSLFSGSKRKDRSDLIPDTTSSVPSQPTADSATRATDLATALHIGPGRPVPAPPAPTHPAKHKQQESSNVTSSDNEFLHIQQFLASRLLETA